MKDQAIELNDLEKRDNQGPVHYSIGEVLLSCLLLIAWLFIALYARFRVSYFPTAIEQILPQELLTPALSKHLHTLAYDRILEFNCTLIIIVITALFGMLFVFNRSSNSNTRVVCLVTVIFVICVLLQFSVFLTVFKK